MPYQDASAEEINQSLQASQEAFDLYKKQSLKNRAAFLYAIAEELKSTSTQLLNIAHQETHLDEARLQVELTRTIFQLTSYGDACAEGTWLDLRIDTADAHRNPPKPDLRKMLVPLGPVVVFGASNFPFAYSTAGGDTACALAAGCTVLLKAHAAHAGTSQMVASAVQKAAQKRGLPKNIFIHLHGAGFNVGKALVQHPLTKAVGFTGSFEGGKALFNLAAQRDVPIPVFAEMGSVNPVFLFTKKIEENAQHLAATLAASITQSVGQFCTNPGVLVGMKSDALTKCKQLLGEAIRKTSPDKMLHAGIAKSFRANRTKAVEEGATIIATNEGNASENESIPTLAEVSAQQFLQNPFLHKEVFGPYSLLVECDTEEELVEVASAMEGQLTCTIWATMDEANANDKLLHVLKEKCGRFIFNGVPTGVEVALSMQHGGPYPATTDSRFTAVGADGIKRFARPFCFQAWPNDLLPDELKNENPLGLWRTVNNVLTKNAVGAD